MSDTLVRVEGVSKRFCKTLKHTMLYGAADLARSFVGFPMATDRLRDGEFWALEDISFELNRGECLGLIGPNGAGKSTLLKILNGIMAPDRGRVEMAGRVGALIEVGAGFHPLLTGRENIYVNGAILGMSQKEINDKLDDIITFSGIADFIDSPVKHYSSGMFIRLGFSIAIHSDPDLLIIDEALSVGDPKFQRACFNRIMELKETAGILIASHDMESLKQVCDSGLMLERGKVKNFGEPKEVILKFIMGQFGALGIGNNKIGLALDRTSYNSRLAYFKDFKVSGLSLNNVSQGGERVRIDAAIGWEPDLVKFIGENSRSENIIVGYHLVDSKGLTIMGMNTALKEITIPAKGQNFCHVVFWFEMPVLSGGDYFLTAGIAYGSHKNHVTLCWEEEMFRIKALPDEKDVIGRIHVDYDAEVVYG